MILLLKRLIWMLSPLPRSPQARDLVLMERAGAVLDHYHDGTRPTVEGVRLASRILRAHSLPTHAIRSMTRERDADLIAQAQRAQDELRAEHDASPTQ